MADLNYPSLGRGARISRLGDSALNAARSALDIRKNPAANRGSGVYWLNKGSGPYQAWCDMETDGGGWEKIDFMVNTTQKAGSSRSRGSFSTLDALSVIRVTGAIDATGSYVSDSDPLPFANEYMCKSIFVQAGGGGYNHKPALRAGAPTSTYNNQSIEMDVLRVGTGSPTWAVGQYGVGIVSRYDLHARHYLLASGWEQGNFSDRGRYGYSWDSTTDVAPAWPKPGIDVAVYFGVATWSDSGSTNIGDHSLWIR